MLWRERKGCYVTPFDFCFVNKWQRGEKLSSAACGSHQTGPNMARTGLSGAEAYPPPLNWEETPTYCPPPSQLSSINSFHTGQQPGILHIPPASYLKFISNNCSIKGNVCNLHRAVITGLRAGSYVHVDNGRSLRQDTAFIPLFSEPHLMKYDINAGS